MHLITNKSSLNIHSTSGPKIKNASQTLIYKQSFTNLNSLPETQRANLLASHKSIQNEKSTGLIGRALSSAKSTIQKLIPSSKIIQDDKVHVIGNKYVYHDDDLIGKGYSSNVYKGSHIQNRQSKNYAIKILDLAKITGFLLDLLRKEIKIHRNLNHPNVVKCYDVIQTESHIYLIQEYCSGGDLAAFISQRKNKILQGQALSIMSQIAQGCKYLIKQNILHRDLKPCNIFRCKMDDKWKIGDFGFSCKSDEQPDDINVGTPIYMPPQSLQKSVYSHKSDLFSLGVMMYELIFGKVPWFSKSESILVRKMRQSKIDFQPQKRSITNPLIRRFIQKCCQIDVTKRMTEDQFLKLELYPRMPHDSKFGKRKSSSQLKNSKSKIQTLQRAQKITIHQDKNTKNKENTQISKAAHKQFQSQTHRTANSIYTMQKTVQTSQYSTQAQTHGIQQDISESKLSQVFKGNSEILYKQNCFCKHLYFMIKNIEHFMLEAEKKQLLVLVMFRHIINLLKKLKNSKFNYFQLKKWESYRLSNEYTAFHKEVTINLQRIEAEYFRFPKRKDIRILREADSKFKELDHQVEFNLKFYQKITQWLKELIQDFNQSIINKPHPTEHLDLAFNQTHTPNKNQLKIQKQENQLTIQSKAKLIPKSTSKPSTPLPMNKYASNSHISQKQEPVPSHQKVFVSTGQRIKAKAQNNNLHQSSIKSKNSVCVKSQLQTSPSEEEQCKFQDFESIQITINLNDTLKKAQLKLQKDTAKSYTYQASFLSEIRDLANKAQSKSQCKLTEMALSDYRPESLNFNQKDNIEDAFYDHLPHATLQALMSLLQYYNWMDSKMTNNKDVHTSFSLIEFHYNQEEENILSLIRQYSKVKFKPEDIVKVKNLVKAF